MAKVVLLAAVGSRGELGKDGDLIWRMPGDLARAKETTMGHPVIMGRKTYESLPASFRPLKERTNIVLSRGTIADEDKYENVFSASDIQEALSIARQSEGSEEIYIFGGAEVYRLALPYATHLYLTEIEARDSDADVYFPRWQRGEYQETHRESFLSHDPQYHFVEYEKKAR